MKIAAVTMVYKDNWFLGRWLEYYGNLIGQENLYVVAHGDKTGLPEMLGGAHLIAVPRDPNDVYFDRRRWGFLSQYASALTGYYDAVICLDVDEFLVPTDPDVSFKDALDWMDSDTPRCVPGFEVFAEDSSGEAVDAGAKFAPNMEGAVFSPFYSKSCIIQKPGAFSDGAHGMMDEKPELLTDLALIHLRFANLKELERRNSVREDMAWGSIESWDEFQSEGKPLATWRRADQRSRQAFRGFRKTPEASWDNMFAAALADLDRLRVRRGNVHKFLNKNFQPYRAKLPEWMHELF